MTRTDGYRFSIHLYVDVPVEGRRRVPIYYYMFVYILCIIYRHARARERGHGQKSPRDAQYAFCCPFVYNLWSRAERIRVCTSNHCTRSHVLLLSSRVHTVYVRPVGVGATLYIVCGVRDDEATTGVRRASECTGERIGFQRVFSGSSSSSSSHEGHACDIS